MGNCLLQYVITSNPTPLELNTRGEVVITARPLEGQTVYCDYLTLTIPTGSSVDALCFSPGDISSDSGTWTAQMPKEWKQEPLDVWGKTFYNPAPDNPLSEVIIKIIASPVNGIMGDASITIVENTKPTPTDPYTEKTLLAKVRKGAEPFYLSYFISKNPATGAPCTEFEQRASIILNWKGSKDNLYTIYRGDQKIFGPSADTSFTLSDGLTRDTSFILEVQKGEDHLFSTLNITVKNPDITPKTVVVTEYLSINSPKEPGNQFQVGGTTTLAGQLNVRGAITCERFSGDGVVPRGAILMWSGDPNNVPAGWALCDSGNGTPDLRGRFIVSYSPTHGDYNAVGKSGGQDNVQLTVDQIPAHAHGINIYNAGGHTHWMEGTNANGLAKRRRTIWGETTVDMGYGGGSDADRNNEEWRGHVNTDTVGDHSHGAAITNTGGNGGHENRPAYFVLAFIMKL